VGKGRAIGWLAKAVRRVEATAAPKWDRTVFGFGGGGRDIG
jgi:hypothetical protein